MPAPLSTLTFCLNLLPEFTVTDSGSFINATICGIKDRTQLLGMCQ